MSAPGTTQPATPTTPSPTSSATASGTAPEKPNLENLPNFDALGEWFAKLKSWCEHAQDTIEDLGGKLDDAEMTRQNDVADAKAEVEFMEGEIERARDLKQFVEDVFRKVRDSKELKQFVDDCQDFETVDTGKKD